VDGKSSNITINVTYIDSNSRVGKISYVDSTTGTEVGNAPISGKIGSTISITDTINKNVPKDYEIASGQNIPKTVTVTDSGIETVVVKVEKTATGKISYVDSTTNKEVGSATITGKVGHTISIIDTVNNNIPKDYELVPGQTIPTVDVTENGISTVNIKVQKKTVTGKISYIDVDANDKEVQTTDLSAKAGETVRISTSIPENYELVSDQNIPTEVTATSSGIPTVTVKIKHKTQDVSDTDPGAHQARTITEYYNMQMLGV
jgi:predicted RNA-binding protein